MKRILAIWLPNWPIQRRRNNRPELAGRALILQAPSRRGQMVAACSDEARAASVHAGMPIAEAVTLVSSLPLLPLPAPSPRRGGLGRGDRREAMGRGEKNEVQAPHSSSSSSSSAPIFEPHDPIADRRALADLARWCCQFSPTVGLEDNDAPDTLFVDVTRLAPLYGGEEPLVRQVAQAFQRRALVAHLALADTLGAAWALAHYGHRAAPPNLRATPHALLAPLPLAALRLPSDMLETLAELGLEKVAHLLALPREQLRSRFGPLLLTRLDQALGAAREVFAPVEPPPDFTVEHAFEFPLSRQDAIHYAIERLLQRLAWLLSARNAGALRLRCRFDCEAAPPVAVEFDLFQPTAKERHLLEILDLHLERVRLPAPATSVTLRVLRHAPLSQRQVRLFEHERTLAHSRQLAALVDRLAGRLGGESVVRCSLQSDAQPELAYREEPLVDSGLDRRPANGRPLTLRLPPAALDRPLCLLSRPAELETISLGPDGPPTHFARFGRRHAVARSWGPERVETGWWRRTGAWRDYYRVETNEGRRFWLFRRRRDGRWFLHGAF